MHIKSVLYSITISAFSCSLVNASETIFYPFWTASDSTKLIQLGQELELGNRYNPVSEGFVFDHCLSGTLTDINKRVTRKGNAIYNATNQQLAEFITGQSPLLDHRVEGSPQLLDSILSDAEPLTANLYYITEMLFIENMITPDETTGTYNLHCEDIDLTGSSFITAIEYSASATMGISVTFQTADDYHLLVDRFNFNFETIYNSDDLTVDEIESLNNTSLSLNLIQFGGNQDAYQTVKNSIDAECYFVDGLVNSNCLSDLEILKNYIFGTQQEEGVLSFEDQLSSSASSFFPRRVFMHKYTDLE